MNDVYIYLQGFQDCIYLLRWIGLLSPVSVSFPCLSGSGEGEEPTDISNIRAQAQKGMVFMKKLTLVLLAVLLLCSCGRKQEVYETEYQGRTFTVDTVNQWVTCGGQTYAYEYTGNQLTITYPDGSKFWWEKGELGSFGGSTDLIDENKYVPSDDLLQVLEAEAPSQGGGKNWLLALILLLIGGWYAASPHSVWYLGYGWRFKDAEPSEAVLIVTRIGGFVLVALGLIFLLF